MRNNMRHIDRLFNETVPGRILVWDQEYDNYYYNADTPERLEAACLDMLRIVIEWGWVFSVRKEPAPPEFDVSLIEDESLPQDVRDGLQRKLDQYEYQLEARREETLARATAETALDRKDGKLAYKALSYQNKWQNVDFEIEVAVDPLEKTG